MLAFPSSALQVLKTAVPHPPRFLFAASRCSYYQDVTHRNENHKIIPGSFDVCVIGCGPAGFAATMRAYDLKKRVCVIEKAKVGGTGLHNGALSSKALWEVSRQYKDTHKFVRCFEKNDDLNR